MFFFFFLNFLLKPLVGGKGLRKRIVSLWCHIYTSDCLLYLIGNGQAGSRSPLTTFQDAVRHCQTASYLEQHMSHIKPTIKHRGMAAVTNKLFGPPSMNSSLHMERNLIFALALCMFKNDEPMHNHVLQTIYKKLTGTKLDCPRYGNHWELIGFQGAQFTYMTMYMYILCLAKMAINKIKLKSQFLATSLRRTGNLCTSYFMYTDSAMKTVLLWRILFDFLKCIFIRIM